MTREEEIIKASVDYNAEKGKLNVIGGDNILSEKEHLYFNQNPAFIAGAEWADQHPINYDGKAMLHVLNKSAEQAKKRIIDEACEWWKNEFTHLSMNSFEIKYYKDKIDEFRKAMEKE